jgi:membrane glycosyltransferase
MQFAGTLYGPIFQAGLNYWQAASGNFWGHNAIIRCAPFMEHCSLPVLPAPAGRGRMRFMSHDYIEAALMRRANCEVWLAYELDGSYENLPPSPLDHAARDRRWCRGNLQHAWMLTAKGLHGINRLHLLMGILSYAASPLWLLFLLFGMLQGWLVAAYGPGSSFDSDVGLSAFLDIGGGWLALLLFGVAVTMLTLPKFLAAVLVIRDRKRRIAYGGAARLLAGVAIEHALSVLLAPVQMIFNSRFVIEILMGRDVPWNPQRRDVSGGVDWEGITKAYALHTVIGLVWAFLAWTIGPAFFWWLSPVTFGLILSMPVAVFLSMHGIGKQLRRIGLFAIPAETRPPRVVSHLAKNLESIHQRLSAPPWLEEQFGITQVVLDPYVSAAHCSLLRAKRTPGSAAHRYVRELSDRLLAKGPAALSRREQMVLLRNRQAVEDLHERVWHLPEARLSQWWRMAMRHYNTLTDRPLTALYR